MHRRIALINEIKMKLKNRLRPIHADITFMEFVWGTLNFGKALPSKNFGSGIKVIMLH